MAPGPFAATRRMVKDTASAPQMGAAYGHAGETRRRIECGREMSAATRPGIGLSGPQQMSIMRQWASTEGQGLLERYDASVVAWRRGSGRR